MQVELAEERILLFADRFNFDYAEGRAWAKRVEAFGTVARIGGLLNRTGADDYECVYRERRLQPFWRLHSRSIAAYERMRTFVVPVAPEVRAVTVHGDVRSVDRGAYRIDGLESCREDTQREAMFDGLTRLENPGLSATYLGFQAAVTNADELARAAQAGTVVVPPTSKSSSLVREVVSSAIGRIEADRILEERLIVDAVDLFYRPVYAFRYHHAGKEAVIEFDGLTGEARPGGATFEQYLGKVLEPRFLLDAGIEAVNMFVPGTQLARIVVQHGVQHIIERNREADPR
ncbi:MAG TPA: hypothetical protein VIT20_07600 [Propionibacteriaceae bacterium]